MEWNSARGDASMDVREGPVSSLPTTEVTIEQLTKDDPPAGTTRHSAEAMWALGEDRMKLVTSLLLVTEWLKDHLRFS